MNGIETLDPTAFSEDSISWSQSLKRASVGELADRLSIKKSIDSGIAYHRAYADRRENKIEARSLVRSLFSRRKFPKGLSILTMPGMNWAFENVLLGSREGQGKSPESLIPKRTFITSIERDENIYRIAAMKMPGRFAERGIQQKESAPFASWSLRTASIGRFHRCSFEDMASWYSRQSAVAFDAAWLDFCGPLTPKRLEMIEKFWENSIRKCLVITATEVRHHLGDFDYRNYIASMGKVVHVHRYCDTIPLFQLGIEKP